MHHWSSALAVFVVLTLLASSSCKSEQAEVDDPAVENKSEKPTGDEAPMAKKRRSREKEDRGDASMKLGDTEWVSKSANATFRGNTLKIKASKTNVNSETKKVSRQELHLLIRDYKGPGTYTVANPSMLIGVGFDAGKADKEGDDGAEEAAKEALTKAKTLILMAAEVTVTSANDDELVGTFRWKPLRESDPAIEDGKFRAVVKK